MTWPVPSKIDVPALSDLPFIRIKYERLLLGKSADLPVDDDHDFEHNFFYNPASVAYEQAVSLQLLSDKTFAGLCQAMEPKFYDKPFRDKASLEAITLDQFDSMNEFEEDNGHAVFEQVMSYILFKSRVSRDVRWDKIAELYNASEESQQRALAFYFDKCENRDLLDMLSTKAPATSYQSEPLDEFQSKTEGADTFFLEPADNRWVREDRFANQFEAHALDGENNMILIGTGPSLKSALGKAISYVRDNEDDNLRSVSIVNSRVQIAEGRVTLSTGSNPSPMVNWPVTGGTAGENFSTALYAVEKSLGLYWSKVRRLEDELGL